ncbi:MAG TPA: protein translocase subunit SecD [Anaerolineae bacterium]|nr:protein translocase subunit SecD [Anaerolineae bacterium]
MENNTGRDLTWLIIILVLVGGGIWIATNPNYPIIQGLDLQGGLQVLLQADLPGGQEVTSDQMITAQRIINDRINGLGVAEATVQIEGDDRILIELPGIENQDEAIGLIQGTALLEFIDTGTMQLPEGSCVRTSENNGAPSPCEIGLDPNGFGAPTTVYDTVLTGAGLENATVINQGGLQPYVVGFELKPDASDIFEEHTSQNQGRTLTIVLDKVVLSSPTISAVIRDEGTITGNFTVEEAQELALQLRYGSLPVPLTIEGTRQVGATLGTESIESSIQSGIIGLIVVLLFMIVYYRVPGILAALALLVYALLNFAFYKLAGVTMTLPAITGFLLSTGMAVDANILVFERMKEELRAFRTLPESIDAGFDRAWTSIRDSNIATLVICVILFVFGRNFGASIVTGFAVTLSIGVFISLFTAITVTRTFVRLVLGQAADFFQNRRWLLGV